MKLIATLFFIIICQNGIAQNSYFIGKLVNSKTKEPICFANISIKNTGTSSDKNGIFILKFKSVFSITDSLKISCIGYQAKAISIKNLSTSDTNIILMIPVVYNIKGLSVEAEFISPYNILQYAFEKVKKNNNSKKEYFMATFYEKQSYYDEKQNTKKNREIYISSIFEDLGYNNRINKHLGIKENFYIKGVFIKNNFGLLNIANNNVTTHKHLLYENPLRYKPKNEIFNNNKKYIYSLQESYFDSILQKNILVIDIKAIDTISNFGKCKVFIGSGNYEIFRIDLNYEYEKELKYKRRLGESVDGSKNYFYSIEYILNDKGKMELKRITMEFGVQNVNTITDHVNFASTWKCELKIIERVNIDIYKINKLPKLDKNDNIFNQKIINNKSYWLDYNVIIKE